VVTRETGNSSGVERPERDVTCLLSVYLFTTKLRPICTMAWSRLHYCSSHVIDRAVRLKASAGHY